MIPDEIKFSLFLIFYIPSTLCALFVLYHLLFDRTLRQALHNHVIIALLVICLLADGTLYPWMLYYYHNKNTWNRSMIFCTIWGFLDWSLYILHTMLFAWATVERHILIFHDRWVSTRKKRLIFHYFPLVFFPIYLFLFYFLVYFIPPCENYPDPASPVCMWPCLYDSYTLSMYDYVVEQVLPTFTIVFCSITLLGRVLWQRVRTQRTIHWKKHRKMAIQVLCISLVYLLLLLPYATIYILRFYVGLSNPLLDEFSTSTAFTSYFIILLFPFVCAVSLPELQTKVTNLLLLRRRRQIHPGMTLLVRVHPHGYD
ncbi:unnamed protein product [Adineta ricciae]|uniref:G-protein coupled receptors family 1 profile domain-containing protein n=1 Tax=Adineta ricciae TaxID=249248 RepID=A0A813YB46_ADIRI|nr:unnamed protein product [Adineta ricciae]CAF1358113.1 unnamed protein product [Adineta ricciae]